MAYSNEIKANALTLWLAGKNHSQISKEMKIPEKTINRWSISDNWQSKKEINLVNLQQAAVESVEEFKQRMIQVLEQEIQNIKTEIPKCKHPTADKYYAILLEYQKLALSLRGIPYDQKFIGVAHKGTVGVKSLDDYFSVKLEDLL